VPGVGSTQPREDNWADIWMKSRSYGSRKSRLTDVGIRCADHAAPSIRKSWHWLCRHAAVALSMYFSLLLLLLLLRYYIVSCFILVCVCFFHSCSHCHWPLCCWVSTQINENWELNYGSTVLCWVLAAFSVSWSYTQSVGLFGSGNSPSQSPYLHTEQHRHRINAHRYPGIESEPTIPAFELAKTVHTLSLVYSRRDERVMSYVM
jgi:hypothetical protein